MREEESGRVEEEESGKALRRMFKPRGRREGRDVKEDREERNKEVGKRRWLTALSSERLRVWES